MTRLRLEHVIDDARTGEFRLASGVKVSAYRNAPLVVSLTTNAAEDDPAPLVVDKRSRVLVLLDDLLIGNTLVEGSTDAGSDEAVTLALVAGDPLAATLGRRRRQTEATYGRTPDATSRSWTATEQTTILSNLVDDENTRADTWIRTTSVVIPTTGVTRSLVLEQGKPVVEAALDMANTFDGFDLAAIPVYESGSPVMADLGVWSRRGEQRPEVVFQFAAGGVSNISQFTLQSDGTRVTTHQSTTGRDTARVQVITDDDPFDGQIYDSEDAFSDVADEALLTTIANQLLSWRSRPRQELSITPDPTSDLLPVRDFDIGDEVRVQIQSPRYSVDGFVRVYGWTLERSETGEARLTSIALSPNDQGGG